MSIFIPPGDPLLQERAAEVPLETIQSFEIQSTLERMFEVAKGERVDMERRVMVGLAAPQIGISKRIILVDIGADRDRKELGDLRAYINPVIERYSEELEEGREGCYSVDSRVVGVIPRATKIQISAYDALGKRVVEELTGFTARIFQHEVDHLDGIRFPDRAGPDGKLYWVEEEEFPKYQQSWKHWTCKCPWNRWIEMKEGFNER